MKKAEHKTKRPERDEAVAPKGDTEAARVPSDRLSSASRIRRFFLFHIKPSRLPKASLRLTHTFGLGGSAVVLFVLLAVTGMLLMLTYEASPEGAYGSVIGLTRFRFGAFVRNIHYWSANLLFAATLLHMLRVFYTGGFHGPRRINWIVGVLMLFGVMGASFTGYLLPWDQLAYWAVTISTGMLGYVPLVGAWLQNLVRGGADIGTDALVVFYAFHTSFIPLSLLVLMGFHFWRVRKAGGVVVPRPLEGTPEAKPESVSSYPDLLLRELAWGLSVIAVVLMLAVFFDAPLEHRANPGVSPNPAKAPWYFIGFQELQLHFHPVMAAVVMPVLMVGALIAVPFLKYETAQTGPWFLSSKGRRAVFVTAAVAGILAAAFAVIDDLWLRPAAGAPTIVGRGVLPLLVFFGAGVGLWRLVKRQFSLSTAEAVQTLFTLVFVVFTVLSVVAICFRGEGMALSLPLHPEGP